jgi:hypothetical protein
MQGDRKMSAVNVPLPNMVNEWKHPAENPVGRRPGQRVVIYPPELDR